MFRHSFLIAGFAVISQILGILRDRMLAHYVGIGPALDIYNASFRLPDLALGMLLAFASAGTVVPFIAKAIKDNNQSELEERFNSLFFFFGGVMVVLCLLLAAILPLLVHILVPGFTAEQVAQYIPLTRILLMQPVLLGLSALISCLAQARHEFLLYSIAPLLYTVVIMASIVGLYPSFGIVGIIFGVVVGAALHLGFQSFTLIKHPIRVHHVHASLKYVREHLKISVPRSGSLIISQLRVIFFTAAATTLGAGALSVYVFAQKITDAIVSIVAQSFSTGSLPLLSSQLAGGDVLSYKRTLKHNILFIFSATVGAALFCYFFAPLVVHALYGNTGSNEEIVRLLKVMLVGMPFFAVAWYLTYAFSAMKDTMPPLYSNAISTSAAIAVLFWARAEGYGLLSIGLSVITVNIVSILVLGFIYTRKKL